MQTLRLPRPLRRYPAVIAARKLVPVAGDGESHRPGLSLVPREPLTGLIA